MSLHEDNVAGLLEIATKYRRIPFQQVNETVVGALMDQRAHIAELAGGLVTALKVYSTEINQAATSWIAQETEVEAVNTELAEALDDSSATEPILAAMELKDTAENPRVSLLKLGPDVLEMMDSMQAIEEKLGINFMSGTPESDPVAAVIDQEANNTFDAQELVAQKIEEYVQGVSGQGS